MTTFVYQQLEFSLPDDWNGNVVQGAPDAAPLAMMGLREESRLEECVVQLSGHDFGQPVRTPALREIMVRQGTSRAGIREFTIGPWSGVGTEFADGEVKYLSLFLGVGTMAIFLLFSAPVMWYDVHRGTLWSILESARVRS
jgi:hypothetical protein